MATSHSEKRGVDMQQLADMAGVSRSTVSRALSDSPLVSDATKHNIRELARKHNFVMNESARSLRLQRSEMVCLVLMHDTQLGNHLADPFFLRMVETLVNELATHAYDLVLYHKPVESAAEFLATRAYRQCDGTIFVGQNLFHEELNRIATYNKPIVVWGADLPNRKYRVVGTDNLEGGRLATRHLLEQGCRRIAFFGDKRQPELSLRYQGYVKELGKAGIAVDTRLELAPPMERAIADEIIADFIDARHEVDGILCCSDMLAASAVSCLQRRGIKVPGEIAVTGWDDMEIGARIHPKLTTVSQDIRGSGRMLVNKLIGLIAGKRIRDSIRVPELVVRESSLLRGV